jgi:predicted nucleic acid-binding protein
VLTLDTSALYALVSAGDEHHRRMIEARDADPGPHYVPAGILSAMAYMIEANLPVKALQAVLADLERSVYTLECGEDDLPWISQLIGRYDNLPLGFSDAAVIACAERHRGRTLTADRRHFDIVAGEGTFIVLPE